MLCAGVSRCATTAARTSRRDRQRRNTRVRVVAESMCRITITVSVHCRLLTGTRSVEGYSRIYIP